MPLRIEWRSTVIALCLLMAWCSLLAVVTCRTTTAVLVTDLHFDPYYGGAFGWTCNDQSALTVSPYGRTGCDTPPKLLDSFVSDALLVVPSVVYMCGDWLRHNMADLPSDSYEIALNGVATSVGAFLDSSLVVPVATVDWSMGNNDVVPDYYFNISKLLQLRSMGNIMLSKKLISLPEKSNFEDCGFYTRDHTASSVRTIVLNTLIWSTALQPPLDASVTDPCGQFRFLSSALDDATKSNLNVVIISHIPPGINVHTALRDGLTSNAMFWRGDFQSAFISLVASYRQTISFMLFGHTHMFSVVADPALGVPMYILPSLTQAFGNQPSYMIATLNVTNGAMDKLIHRVFSLSTSAWTNAYELSSVLGHSLSNFSLLVSSMRKVASALPKDVTLPLLSMYTSGAFETRVTPMFPGGSCGTACQRILFCSMTALSLDDVTTCTTQQVSVLEKSATAATTALTVICSIAALAVIFYLVLRWRTLEVLPPVLTEKAERVRLTFSSSKSAARYEVESERIDGETAAAASAGSS